MACQGCGRASENRLCCPTCIEYGRTSFFCGQECFTANWKVHSQLHEHLKKKQELNAAQQGGSKPSSSQLPRVETHDRGRPGVGGSSIAGGASLAPPRKPAAAAPPAHKDGGKKDGGAPGTSAASMFGSITQAWNSAFSGSGAAATGASSASKQGNSGQLAGKVRMRSQSPAPRTMGNNGGATAASMPKSQLQMGLCALAMFTFVGACFLYREHQRYGDEDHVIVPQPVSEDPDQKAIATPAPEAIASSAVNADDLAAQARSKDVTSLRAEVNSLREMLDRHDKMLRYVMERYVEKESIPGSGGIPGGGAGKSMGALPPGVVPHEVNLSDPEFVSKSMGSDSDFLVHPDLAAGARRNDLVKKRKGSGEVGMGGFAQPGLETYYGAAEAPKIADASDSKAVGAISSEGPASKSQPSVGLMFPG